jgi:predicted deacylase
VSTNEGTGVTIATRDIDTTATRVIGRIDGRTPGPVLVCVAGMHGNEPAGVEALTRVLDTLTVEAYQIAGTFVALLGNQAALGEHVRFVDTDLNRHWTRERMGRVTLDRDPDSSVSEDADLLELHDLISDLLDQASGESYLLDLHTTSGRSAPFGTVGDTLRNRRFAMQLPLPLIMGLEEHLEGTMLEFFNDRGHVTLGLEGGRHEDEGSVDRIEAAVWLALEAAGILHDPRAAKRLADARAFLTHLTRNLPRVLEVRHRHFVGPDDQFTMRPGYASFQEVVENENLADDETGPVIAPETGIILMPLYQPAGDDGFFVTREFSPFWLSVSALLRRMRFDHVLPWMPGITRDPTHGGTLLVNGRVARWFALEVFHLLGYRKRRQMGEVLVVTRRREGSRGEE